MNRFDRVNAIHLLLQTRSVVTAQFLAEHFSVTERTIYRDIRSLENAGVPIGSEPGLGYFLRKGYRLPPVSFTFDEAASLLLGDKLLTTSLDQQSLGDYKQALNKVRAVLDQTDKDFLNSLDADVQVLHPSRQHTAARQLDSAESENNDALSSDRWMRECRSALIRSQVVKVTYNSASTHSTTERTVEPIGLFFYSQHWHLIAWCRLREAYRDFRLDRILEFHPLQEQFARHSRSTLQEYLDHQQDANNLIAIDLLFTPEASRFVQEQRYLFGFVNEESVQNGIKMSFLTSVPHYMARWLLQYTNGVSILKGDSLQTTMEQLSQELLTHWSRNTTGDTNDTLLT